MIESVPRLSAEQLAAVADLERRVVGVDGGRLKLEWDFLKTRSGDEVNDLLGWDGDRLAGFVGLYAFDGRHCELAGMVDPELRRRGIGTALLQSAVEVSRRRLFARTLLVVPRSSTGGRHLAEKFDGSLHHSEHALLLTEPPAQAALDPCISVRAAQRADLGTVCAVLQAAFGDTVEGIEETFDHPTDRNLVIDLDGDPIGTVRLSQDADSVGIYGFAIDPAHQGRGIGRQVLRTLCRNAFENGAASVHLEVEVDNEHALGLYTSTGFRPVATEDYYELPV